MALSGGTVFAWQDKENMTTNVREVGLDTYKYSARLSLCTTWVQ